MPIYEYECKACGHYMEAVQKISEPPLLKCPECNKRKLIKLVSSPSFKLKGTGWYETDFKHKGKKPEKKAETAETNDTKKTSDKTEKQNDKPKKAEKRDT